MADGDREKLSGLKKAELLELAHKLSVEPPHDINKADLVELLLPVVEELDRKAKSEAAADQPLETPEVVPPEHQPSMGDPGDLPPVPPEELAGTYELTNEDHAMILRGDTDKLRSAVAAPTTPAVFREAIQRELVKREQAAADLKAAEERKTEIPYYRVTKGGFFVVNGFRTPVPTGSLVSPITSDLPALKAQGIEWDESKVVKPELRYTQSGTPYLE